MIYKNNKRGELTSGQIVVIVILVISFAAIIFFYNALDFGKQVDWDTCHASIIARGAARYGEIIELGPTSIPLKCKTEKYCVTDSKNLDGKCSGLPQTNDNKIKAQVIEKEKGSLREQYIDFLSEQIYSCNKLLGEGDVNFLPTESWDKNYCLVCSRIEVDKRYQDQVGQVTYLELYKHMQEKVAPDGKSYLEHLGMLDAEKSLGDILASIKYSDKNLPLNNNLQRLTLQEWYIPEEQFAIISMIHIDGDLEEVITGWTTGVVVAGAIIAGIFTGGTAWASIPFIIGATATAATGIGAGVAAGGFFYALGSGDNDLAKGDKEAEYFYMPPTIQKYDSATINALGCNSFETAP
jgi:hypothetical protein